MKSVATDDRFVIFALTDERKKDEKCGYAWPLPDFRDQG
jgi:hypothetical protein